MKEIKDMTINELWDMKDELCKLYNNKCDKCPVKDECMFNYEGGTINFMEEVRKAIDKYHDDEEAKAEELELCGYYTLDTIRERLKEGSMSLNDIWEDDCDILDYLCEALKNRDYISSFLAREYVSKYNEKLARFIEWDDDYQLINDMNMWRDMLYELLDDYEKQCIARDYIEEKGVADFIEKDDVINYLRQNLK